MTPDGDRHAITEGPERTFSYVDAGAKPTALAALSTWSVLEALTPRTYARPRDLVEGQGEIVAVREDDLPWSRDYPTRAGYKTYFRVALGAVDMRVASRAILEAFGQDEASVPSKGNFALLAMLLLDDKGNLVGTASSVSSFGWALPLALSKDLGKMAKWPDVEQDTLTELNGKLLKKDPDDPTGVLPVGIPELQAAEAWLAARFGIGGDFAVATPFAIRIEHRPRNGSVPAPYLLNSTLMDSVERARTLVESDSAPVALAAYLGIVSPGRPRDVLSDRAALADLLSPSKIPPARWPVARGRSLVTLQQAAVAAALADLGPGEGVLGVNGPPGTGKTTMIRDLVAGNVVARAEAMCSFEDPEGAFDAGPPQLRSRRIAAVSPRLRGHEIFVASSNNKAVENISKELPQLQAMDVSEGDVSYFRITSDYLAGVSLSPDAPPADGEAGTWGLVSAAMGNAANKSAFVEGFWWNEDHGVRTRLRLAAGENVRVAIKDKRGNLTGEREPHMLGASSPPRNRQTCLRLWREARDRFLALRSEISTRFADLVAYEATSRELESIRSRLAASDGSGPDEKLSARLAKAHSDLAEARRDLEATPEPSEADERALWEAEREEASLRMQAYARTVERLSAAVAARTPAGSSPEDRSRLASLEAELAALAPRVTGTVVDEAFFAAGHEAWNLSVPWLDEDLQARRSALFKAAMEVHEAFLSAAARPLLRNLGCFVEFMGAGSGSPDLISRADDLWATFFLVVPVVSTTFASAGRMMAGLTPASMGWLVVDEAGQAVPQAAVGALTACRNGVFVGDPLQVEPVTTLPPRMAAKIAEHFGLDHAAWVAPAVSAQALADAASPLKATFHAADGDRQVGLPLLVHRRCQEPMFGISNRIAYDGQMVFASFPTDDPSKASGWIDVEGGFDGKWSEEEGDVTATLIEAMARRGSPDIYVISPFRDVASRLRQRLEGVVSAFVREPRTWVNDRVGTIHTFQGREARAVVLVLGAGGEGHAGARIWASRAPNIANVAVTRAKSRLYVVGSRRAWSNAGVFKDVSAALPGIAMPSHSRRDPERKPADAPPRMPPRVQARSIRI